MFIITLSVVKFNLIQSNSNSPDCSCKRLSHLLLFMISQQVLYYRFTIYLQDTLEQFWSSRNIKTWNICYISVWLLLNDSLPVIWFLLLLLLFFLFLMYNIHLNTREKRIISVFHILMSMFSYIFFIRII